MPNIEKLQEKYLFYLTKANKVKARLERLGAEIPEPKPKAMPRGEPSCLI